MDDLLAKGKTLKDRLISEHRFDEAAKVRDLIHTIENMGETVASLERFVLFYASEPIITPKG